MWHSTTREHKAGRGARGTIQTSLAVVGVQTEATAASRRRAAAAAGWAAAQAELPAVGWAARAVPVLPPSGVRALRSRAGPASSPTGHQAALDLGARHLAEPSAERMAVAAAVQRPAVPAAVVSVAKTAAPVPPGRADSVEDLRP